MADERTYTRDDSQDFAVQMELVKAGLHGMDWEAVEHFKDTLATMAEQFLFEANARVDNRVLLLENQSKVFQTLIDLKTQMSQCDKIALDLSASPEGRAFLGRFFKSE